MHFSFSACLDNGGSQEQRRSCLPSPSPNTSNISLWNILKNNIGKDLSKVAMPVELNEPLNTLQRLCEELEYSELLDKAAHTQDPFERMVGRGHTHNCANLFAYVKCLDSKKRINLHYYLSYVCEKCEFLVQILILKRYSHCHLWMQSILILLYVHICVSIQS